MSEQTEIVGDGWDDYRRNVMPASANAIQLSECRRAFYAGAVWVYGVLIEHGDDGEAEVFRLFDRLRDELFAFQANVGKGDL